MSKHIFKKKKTKIMFKWDKIEKGLSPLLKNVFENIGKQNEKVSFTLQVEWEKFQHC